MKTYNVEQTTLQAVASNFNDPKYCDVVVHGPDERTFYCFKFLLCSHSVVFERMFDSNMIEGRTSEVHVREVDAEAFEAMLVFIHIGQCTVCDTNVVPLLSVADRFHVSGLMEICKSYQRDELVVKPDNCFDLLSQASVFGQEDVVTKCHDFVVRNVETMVPRPEFYAMDFGTIKSLARHATSLCRNPKREHEYYAKVRGLMNWLERGNERNGEELFDELDLTILSRKDIQLLCGSDLIQRCPSLAVRVVKAISTLSRTKVPNPAMYNVCGVWHEYEVQSHGWYYMVARGGAGFGKQALADRKEGFGCEGGLGAYVGATFLLSPGDTLKILIGRGGVNEHVGGGAACVVYIPNSSDDIDVPQSLGNLPHLMLVAGGGGGAGRVFNGGDAKIDSNVNTSGKDMYKEGCGPLINQQSDASVFSGLCDWCDGGKMIGEGGGGFYRGHGIENGGFSFIHPLGLKVLKGVGNRDGPCVGIWKGREIPIFFNES